MMTLQVDSGMAPVLDLPSMGTAGDIQILGPFELDHRSKVMRRNGATISLTEAELNLLSYLLNHEQEIYTPRQGQTEEEVLPRWTPPVHPPRRLCRRHSRICFDRAECGHPWQGR